MLKLISNNPNPERVRSPLCGKTKIRKGKRAIIDDPANLTKPILILVTDNSWGNVSWIMGPGCTGAVPSEYVRPLNLYLMQGGIINQPINKLFDKATEDNKRRARKQLQQRRADNKQIVQELSK